MRLQDLPEPRPSFIELTDDRFIVNPKRPSEHGDYAALDKMLAMTPTDRLRWNECWRQFIRECERRGDTPEMIAAAVWGVRPSDNR